MAITVAHHPVVDGAAFANVTIPLGHKRLMLIDTVMITDAAFFRWPIPAGWWKLQTAQICCCALLLLPAGYDLWSAGKIHRSALWGSLFVVAVQQMWTPTGHMTLWQSFATQVLTVFRSFR